MPREQYDVIVVGLGAVGSAATYQLAKNGVNVLGIDRFSPPHIHGSSHGDTRITRLSIGEGPAYVPLVRRSHQLWRDMEAKVGYELLNQCGGLIMSNVAGADVTFTHKTIKRAEAYGIRHEVIDADEIKRRFPQLELAGNELGYFEPEAGFLRPEKCVAAQIELARRYGASLRLHERVSSYTANSDGITIHTDKASYKAAKIVLAAGAWITELLPRYTSSFKVYGQIPYWYSLKDLALYDRYKTAPIVLWEFGPGDDDVMAVFPAIDGSKGGVKVFQEDFSQEISPDDEITTPDVRNSDFVYEYCVTGRLSGLDKTCIRSAPCLYTVTKDHGFVIGYLPGNDDVIVASPCSGHGFKHSAAVGEVIAQLATTGESDIDVSSFRLSRFAGNS